MWKFGLTEEIKLGSRILPAYCLWTVAVLHCTYISDVICKQKNLSRFLFLSNHVYDKGFGDFGQLKRGNRIRIEPPAMSKQFKTVKVQMRKTTMASYTHQLNKEEEVDVFRLAQGIIFRNFHLPSDNFIF